MNLLILEESEYTEGYFTIKGRKFEHLQSIKKIQVESEIPAGRINQSIGTFRVFQIHNFQVLGTYHPEKIPKSLFPASSIFIAYQRPQTMKKILFLVGMFGIPRLLFFRAAKSEKSYESSSLWKDSRWKEEIILGMEQGKNIFFPEIIHCKNLSELKPHLCKEHFWIFHPGEPKMNQIPKDALQMVLGPEGGFLELELEWFQEIGGQKIGLSEIPYRTEYALVGAISQIELLRSLQ